MPLGRAQNLSSREIKEAAEEKFPEAVDNLLQFLKIPNDGHFPEQVTNNLQWIRKRFEFLEFNIEQIETEGAPLLYAEKKYPNNEKTILFYLQIDGQPADSTVWDQEHPFLPVIKELGKENQWQKVDPNREKQLLPNWRIFARSASDSKGPAVAFLSALEILKSQNIQPSFNIKVLMDFQEEMGSPHLAPAVVANKTKLSADALLIMDGTRHLSNWPTLTFGARGIATGTLRVFGPRYPLHSGQYGNYAPNPVFETASLLSGLKDAQGRVALDGFYDGIELSDKEKKLLNALPENSDSLNRRLGISKEEQVGGTYQEALQYPSLNIRGIRAAWVGDEVRTLIPDEVVVEFDIRLVPESNGAKLMESLKSYIKEKGYYLVDTSPSETERNTYPKLASFTYRLGSQPFRTAMDSPLGAFLSKSMEKLYGQRYVKMRTTGGSQPIGPFVNKLHIPAVSVRIPNPDNNIHAPNENLRLGNFLEGIEMSLAILNEDFK